jgi:hypothetical protein
VTTTSTREERRKAVRREDRRFGRIWKGSKRKGRGGREREKKSGGCIVKKREGKEEEG